MATIPVLPTRPGLEREEPELTTEEDIPSSSNDDPEENARETQIHPKE